LEYVLAMVANSHPRLKKLYQKVTSARATITCLYTYLFFYSIIYLSSIYIFKNGRTDVCLSVGMLRANGNPNPCTDLGKILVQFWHQPPHLPGPRGTWTLKAEGHIFENCFQNKRCLEGCKLTRAASGTKSSYNIKWTTLGIIA